MITTVSTNCLQSSVAADYILNFRFDNYFSADNTDADGVCCNNAETNCVTSCNVLVILCLRPFQSNLPRDLGNCPILTVTTPSTGVYTITQPWPVKIHTTLSYREILRPPCFMYAGCNTNADVCRRE